MSPAPSQLHQVNYLQTWFTRELAALGVAEVIVGVERRIQCRDEIEQSLGGDGITQHTSLTAWALTISPNTCRALNYQLLIDRQTRG